jgi:hypothetical protein
MRETGLHQRLLAVLDEAAQRVAKATDGLTDEQASRPADDGWSVKDQLSHMTFWHEMRFFEISRIARGGRYGFPQTEEKYVWHVNEQMAENRRGLSLDQLVSDLDFAREMVKQAVLAAPEDRLDQSLYAEIGIEGGAAHEVEHAGLIEAWRKKEGI